MKIDNVDGTPVGQILLRPKAQNPDVVDKYLQAANDCIDAGPNKVYNPQLVAKLLPLKLENMISVCTANIAEDASIGNEGVYSSWCTTEVSDYLKNSTHKSAMGIVEAFQGVKEQTAVNVEALRDVLTFISKYETAIKRCTFSPNLFAGTNKQSKE
ncbi:unnamed protein product [Mytilus edulis]|uniref:Uncharacterized protein n=1 Tax=Mytilus edulis TaxID=6550 RepID=A0A8S3Q793_MYTED|nr:unnamed protein product [Mytilus edulis]